MTINQDFHGEKTKTQLRRDTNFTTLGIHFFKWFRAGDRKVKNIVFLHSVQEGRV